MKLTASFLSSGVTKMHLGPLNNCKAHSIYWLLEMVKMRFIFSGNSTLS